MRARTPVELDALETAALSWVGTPFCENSAAKGAGVCCHLLVAEILIEAGWLPRVSVPMGPVKWGQAQGRSLISEWFSGPGTDWFRPVDLQEIQPGDVLGFRVGGCVHHVALVLPDRFCFAKEQVHVSSELPTGWGRRLRMAWRPIPQRL